MAAINPRFILIGPYYSTSSVSLILRCETAFDGMGACGSCAFSIEDVQNLLKNSIVGNVIFKSISKNIVPMSSSCSYLEWNR